jgi:hypothetical protein
MRLTNALTLAMVVALASCGIGSEAGREAAKELSDAADKLGGKAKEISDEWKKEADRICELTDTKISEGQASIAAACQGVADAHAKQECEELSKKAKDLIEQIRKECEKR